MENKEMCKEGSSFSRCSSVGYYYERGSEGVPFNWEMQPGTPINTQPCDIIPPLSPPPAMLSIQLPKQSISIEEPKKNSAFPAKIKLKLRNWKHLHCKRYFSKLTNKMIGSCISWERVREAKRAVEEKQREYMKQREAAGESWVPNHFSVVKDGKDWDCSPLQPTVPRAPLVITISYKERS